MFLLLMSVFALPPQTARAATTSVDCNVSHLINAITAANATTVDDTLDLEAGCTYTLTAVNNTDASDGEDSGLPIIPSTATAGTLTINGSGATITRDSGAPMFRILSVNPDGNLTLNDLTISGGHAIGAGGIANYSGTLSIVGSSIVGNTADSNGGGVGNDGTMTVLDSTFSGNTAGTSAPNSGAGGGITSGGGALWVINSTFYGNSASSAGGAILTGAGNTGTVTIVNSTISGNSTSSSGGAVYDQGRPLTLYNTIFANNTTGGDCVNSGGTITSSHNLIEDSTHACGLTNGTNGNIVGSDPLLGTLTGSPAYFPLDTGSPAIDAGDNALIPSGVTTDEAGNPRIANGTVDMGAYEVPVANPTTTSASNATADFSASAENVTLTATVTSTGGTVNSGSVTFSVYDSSHNPIGSSVSEPVSNGQASATFILPAGTPVGTYTIQADYVPSGTFLASTDTAALTVVAPSISVSKQATDVNGGVLVPGDVLQYTISITNSGGADATGVTLSDAIPANTTYVADSTALNTSPVADVGGAMPFAAGGSVGTVTANGGTATITFEVTVNNPFPSGVTEVDNQATVSGSNFSAAQSLLVASPVITQLTILKQFTASHLSIGASTRLTFTLVNPAGNPALTGLAFSDTLPPGLIFDGTTTTPQCSGTVSVSDPHTLSFTNGTLGAGLSTCAVSAVVKADGQADGPLTNHSSLLTGDGGVTSASGATATIGVDIPPTAIPAVFFECSNLGAQTNGSFTSSGGIGDVHSGDVIGNVYCHVIAKDGGYITRSAEIGIESVLNLGVEQAVDVFGELPGGSSVVPFDTPIQICLRGTGEVLFLNAADASRTVERLAATAQNVYLCVSLPNAGTLVLVSAPSGLGEPPPAPTAAPVSTPLGNCRVTTTNAPLNLRADPSTDAAVLAQLPYNLVLTATARVPGWYRVIYLDGQGWVSAGFVSTAGDCGQ